MRVEILPPKGYELWRPLRDMTMAHPLVQERWPKLKAYLEAHGFTMYVNEVFRYNRRQQWLYGAGRSIKQMKAIGLPPAWARPNEKIVTNASDCFKSAHGWTRQDERGYWVPAAAAIDVVPLGADGKPWTRDDPWDGVLKCLREGGYEFGLVHFTKPGKDPWDRPHLQLKEWSDSEHRVIG